jgi:hypothetical protein
MIPADKLKTAAVRGWLASAENWTKGGTKAKVKIEVEDEEWGTTFLLSIMHVGSGSGRSAAVFLRLNIPKDFGGMARRVSLRRSDFIEGRKVNNAMWLIKAAL